jgi:hypothetical protein
MRTKTLFAAALVGLGSMANAQTTQMSNDAGVVITPEAGDWAIGFNAAPILNYAGNMFNGTIGNSMGSAFVGNDQAIYGKYFVDENTAYRGSLRLATGSTTINSLYAGMNNDSLTNTAKFSGGAVVLSAGLEKRKGHNRLQGYYGGEVMITLGGTNASEEYTYAAAMDTVSLNAGILVDENGTPSTSRPDSRSYGSTFGIGVRGFIGAEYFFAPKVSIAAEYGWGLSYSSTSGSETITSSLSVADNVTTETIVMGGTSSNFGIDTDNLGGAIRLMFHF